MPVEESVDERWLRIWDVNGAEVVIGGGRYPFHDGYDFVDFPVTVSADGLHAQSLVRTIEGPSPMALSAFFRALADELLTGGRLDGALAALAYRMVVTRGA